MTFGPEVRIVFFASSLTSDDASHSDDKSFDHASEHSLMAFLSISSARLIRKDFRVSGGYMFPSWTASSPAALVSVLMKVGSVLLRLRKTSGSSRTRVFTKELPLSGFISFRFTLRMSL